MNILRKVLILSYLIFQTSYFLTAQIAINSDGATPDASAMLDITSTTKGMLIPRMTTAERTAITSPATGLMLYDTDENSFWYYNGTAWTNIGGSSAFTSENGITYSNSNSDDFVFGVDSLNYGSGTESKMFFDNSKSAFRVGGIKSNKWDESNIGDYSIAGGYNVTASGESAIALGYNSTASSDYSIALGANSTANSAHSIALGYYSTASAAYSIALGNKATASGRNSVAIGPNTKASNESAIAFSGATAGGQYATAFSEATANGYYATAFSEATTNGYHATAFSWATASDDYATAFSYATASGEYATAFSDATASGDYATAFGLKSQAYSYNEFAIGTYNTAYTPNDATAFDSADRLFVIGNGTGSSALSDAMVVYKNGNTEINGDLTVSGSIIIGSTAFVSDNGITHSNNNSDDFVFGVDSLNHGSGTEQKIFFDNDRGAFRAGAVNGTTWDEGNLGDYSIGLGYNTTASGDYSTSFGYKTAASGIYSTSFGYETAASGIYSTSFGISATASGNFSTCFGRHTESYSYGETVLGLFNTSYTPNNTITYDSEDRLFVIGNGTGSSALSDAMVVYKNGNTEINGDLTVSGSIIIGSTAFVSDNGITHSNNNNDDFLFGVDSLNHGSGTEQKIFFDNDRGAFRAGGVTGTNWNEDSIGYYSTSFGYNTIASTYFSTSFGFETTANGNSSTSFGNQTTASGYYSTSFGNQTTASGAASASFGFETIASGENATSFGYQTTASGDNATSFGSSTTASGYLSTSFGANTIASGNASTSFGLETTAYSYGEMVLGVYNTVYTPNSTTSIDSDDRLFVIGNGTSATRSDAMIVYKNGNTEINGTLTLNEAFTFPTADGTSSQVLITNGSGTLSWTDYGDDLGTHIATQNIDLDDHDIYFRGGDTNHGVGWRGSTNTFASESPNGPVLYGYRGGGLGTTRNGELLALQWDDNGDVTINGDLTADSYTTASDERLKTNIQPTTYGLTDILNIDVRDYQFKKDKTKHLHTGFLAQQLHTVFPHAVHIGGDDENTNPWTVDYASLTPLLVKGMQEQQQEINDLKDLSRNLVDENKQLKIEVAKIDELKAEVAKMNQQQAEINELKAILQQIQIQNSNSTVEGNK